MLTLAGHGFYWFELSRPVETEPEPEAEAEHPGSALVADLLSAGVVGDGDQRDQGGPR
jgi:maltose alpha-D-glucosyltransferase / alpha-amylase